VPFALSLSLAPGPRVMLSDAEIAAMAESCSTCGLQAVQPERDKPLAAPKRSHGWC
jgi:hypothetical protein